MAEVVLLGDLGGLSANEPCMLERVAFRVKSRVLFDSSQGVEFRKTGNPVRLNEQVKPLFGILAFSRPFEPFAVDAFRRQRFEFRQDAFAQFNSTRLHRKPEPGGELHGAQNPQRVFAKGV